MEEDCLGEREVGKGDRGRQGPWRIIKPEERVRTWRRIALRPGPGPACEEFIRSGLSDNDKKLVLDVHNELRNYVASGKVLRFPATGANMKQLEWDDELELIAKRQADQCIPVKERVCSDSIRFRVGQNIGMAQNIDQQNLRSIEDHVRVWFRSNKHCVVKPIPSNDPNLPKYIKPTFCNDYETTYDFTQLTWGNSYKLGCSYSEFKSTNVIEKVKYATNILICNYAPTGNVRGENPFVVGEPCSACSNGTICSEKYPSLCTGVPLYSSAKFAKSASDFLTKSSLAIPGVLDILKSVKSDSWQSSIKLFDSLVVNVLLYEVVQKLPGPGPACEQLIQSGLIDADKKMVLDVHNELRNYVASGKLKQYPAKSANMRELVQELHRTTGGSVMHVLLLIAWIFTTDLHEISALDIPI
uniref:SCP domain-containing protein n=1 Tax=Rhodnius prolixus TaxID=13249 RepID=T1H7N3_RHOPR